jgi:hypothetical protein
MTNTDAGTCGEIVLTTTPRDLPYPVFDRIIDSTGLTAHSSEEAAAVIKARPDLATDVLDSWEHRSFPGRVLYIVAVRSIDLRALGYRLAPGGAAAASH